MYPIRVFGMSSVLQIHDCPHDAGDERTKSTNSIEKNRKKVNNECIIGKILVIDDEHEVDDHGNKAKYANGKEGEEKGWEHGRFLVGGLERYPSGFFSLSRGSSDYMHPELITPI
jgi:hypothetical protein